jgi:hypothetical protein
MTHVVCGHAVASDTLGEAYVVPLSSTIRQIKDHFKTPFVHLPANRDVDLWRSRHVQPSAGNAQGITDPLVENKKGLYFHEQKSSPRKAEDTVSALTAALRQAGIAHTNPSVANAAAKLDSPRASVCLPSGTSVLASGGHDMSTDAERRPSIPSSLLLTTTSPPHYGKNPQVDSGYASASVSTGHTL